MPTAQPPSERARIDALLKGMFDAAIAIAQPAVRIPQFAPEAPRGRLIVIIACVAAAVGPVIAAGANSVVGLIAALTLVNVGISFAKPPLWSMPTMFLSGTAAATGIATINSIGNLGGFVAPSVIGWIKDSSGSYAGGLYFVAGLLVFSAVLTLIMSRFQTREQSQHAYQKV